MRLMRVRGLAFVLWLNACHTWRPVELAPTPAFPEKERVRVVRSDRTTTELTSPRFIDDSLVGRGSGPETRLAIPRSDIRRVETRQISEVRTLLLIAGVAVAVYLAVGAYAASHMNLDIPLQLERVR